jgi:hypothetical protein
VGLQEVSITPSEIDGTNDTHTLSFKVVNLSPDDSKDEFSITLPSDVNIEDASFVDTGGLNPAPEDPAPENPITFTVNPSETTEAEMKIELALSSRGGESFRDDFEYSSNLLSENGWKTQYPSIQTSNSYLTTSSNENKQFVYRQINGFSEIEFNGVQNSERFFGLRIILSETRNGSDSNRIGLTVEQDRNTENFDYGSVSFYNSKFENDANIQFAHGGELNDYRIVKNPDGTAELFINGSSYGQIGSADEVDISYIGIRFDAPDQRIDSISHMQ